MFFCFGPPKSGTTLLQRALNLHPQVSCPSEHRFVSLFEGLKQLCRDYNHTLELIDRRTGGQGATLISDTGVCTVCRTTVELIVREAAQGKPIMGANENNILYNLALFDVMFDRPKLIAIFRNPVDQGLSAWHHNLRLAREENDPRHSHLVTQFGGQEGWLRQVALYFNHDVAVWRKFIPGRDNVHTVRYEDLVARRGETLRGIFSFLGARVEDAMLKPIVEASGFARMRAASKNPAFFRSGATNLGGDEVSAELRREIVDLSADAMAWLGYKVAQFRERQGNGGTGQRHDASEAN
jgi:hypothetical protein